MTTVHPLGAVYDSIEAETLNPVWISLVPRETAMAKAESVNPSLPLAGMTFAVKDNIDVAGMPTTAGCPAYAYTPRHSAPVVSALEAAGAALVGKTNMDQFATGLVGTRSPYGACSSVYSERHISGGSSSGSAVAVAKGLVSFSLGTDTAGSGRVPAAFNNLVGLKPTRGLLSTRGIVPACRSLDCVAIFAPSVELARKALAAARVFDPQDPFARAATTGDDAAPWVAAPTFRFGVPRRSDLEFFGDDAAADLYARATRELESCGGEKVEIDFKLFRAAADLLYSGPWVAERLAAIEDFVRAHRSEMNPVVGGIIERGVSYSAVDAFRGMYRLRELIGAAASEWERMDVLALPTAGTIFTHEQVAADPVGRNTDLGYYTNFVNLMDLAAVAVPAGFRPDGLPFGISLIGPTFADEALLSLAGRYMSPQGAKRTAPGCVEVAVVGAHLAGQPLNGQLTQRRSRLVRTAKTAPGYRLYALRDAVPPKPGLVRDPGFEGPGIEVEIWAVPEHEFGSFVAGVPAPLGIGNATLENGESVKAFICEPHAIAGSWEITAFGGWRSYLASLNRH